MSVSIICKGVCSLAGRINKPILRPTPTSKIQIAGIISKVWRDKDYKRPPAYPYKTKNYGVFEAIFDKTTWRFDENSKIIVIDGPVASGKAALSKKIAEELDMLHVPHAHLDSYYINSYGYDMRQVNDKLPQKLKSFDVEEFLINPNDIRTSLMQMRLFLIRLDDYIDALGHVLSTGQGVVLNRSVFSDFVFVETLRKFGYIRKEIYNYYYTIWNMMKVELMRPHLIIYLDAPVEKVLDRVKKENPNDINSPFMKPEVLEYIRSVYKNQFLKGLSNHSEILVYDWSEIGDSEVVVEDIERVNFDKYDLNSSMLRDWDIGINEWNWNEKRMSYTKNKPQMLAWVRNVPAYNYEEVSFGGEDKKKYLQGWYSAPGMKYDSGFNTDEGDVNVAFRTQPERTRF